MPIEPMTTHIKNGSPLSSCISRIFISHQSSDIIDHWTLDINNQHIQRQHHQHSKLNLIIKLLYPSIVFYSNYQIMRVRNISTIFFWSTLAVVTTTTSFSTTTTALLTPSSSSSSSRQTSPFLTTKTAKTSSTRLSSNDGAAAAADAPRGGGGESGGTATIPNEVFNLIKSIVGAGK